MSVGRRWVALACIVLASPAASQQKREPDIVVTAATPKKGQPADWKRAEFDHVVLYGQGSDAELKRVGQNLERLYWLMSRLYRRGDTADVAVKPQITLVGSGAEFRAMGLADLRSAEGPYLNAFTERAYYDPREDGAIIALPRSRQIVDLNTSRAYDLDCDETLADGAQDCPDSTFHEPAVQTWEQRLYAAYARHFLLTYAPAAYPRWYLDGIGVLFSTMTVRRNGAIDYAEPPENYRQVFRAYGNIDVGRILTGDYLGAPPGGKMGWSPYHAWLLTHYFVFSALKPDRSRQFAAYMAAIGQGKPMAEAAKAFGDMKAVQRDVIDYIDRDKSFARTAPAPSPGRDPLIAVLSPGAAAAVAARLELDTRLARDAVLRGGWIAQLRETLAKLPYDTGAQLLLAEAECRAGQAAECQADAARVLARTPDNVEALTWKGVALTDLALSGPPIDRAARLILARAAIVRALSLDGDSPDALIAWFQSYARAGEPVPEPVLAGMARVVAENPVAPAPRLYLAGEMKRRGERDIARRLVQTVIYGAYASPERAAAQALLAG